MEIRDTVVEGVDGESEGSLEFLVFTKALTKAAAAAGLHPVRGRRAARGRTRAGWPAGRACRAAQGWVSVKPCNAPRCPSIQPWCQASFPQDASHVWRGQTAQSPAGPRSRTLAHRASRPPSNTPPPAPPHLHPTKPKVSDYADPEVLALFEDADAQLPFKHFQPRFPDSCDPSLSLVRGGCAHARVRPPRAGRHPLASTPLINPPLCLPTAAHWLLAG